MSENNQLNIVQRILAVMKDVEYVQKEDKKVNNQYTFVSHDAVKEKLRPALVKHGVLPWPNVTNVKKDGNMVQADMQVDFINADNHEDRLTLNVFGFGIDNSDKGPGKAMSYAIKYALLLAFQLVTGDDPERDNIPHAPEPPAITGEQKKKLDAFIDMMRGCTTGEQLKAIYNDAWVYASEIDNLKYKQLINQTKDTKIAELKTKVATNG